MLPVYGAMMPLRLLEEIVFRKTQEMEHTVVIRDLIPQLEPPYVQLMLDWQNVFVKTSELAQAGMRAASTVPGYPLPPEWSAFMPRLVNESLLQSHEFIRQLQLLQEQSPAVHDLSAAPMVLSHIRRESEYFISVIEDLQSSAALPWMRLSEDPDDSPESYGGPEPADGAMRQDRSDEVESSEVQPTSGMLPVEPQLAQQAEQGREQGEHTTTIWGQMHSFKVQPDPADEGQWNQPQADRAPSDQVQEDQDNPGSESDSDQPLRPEGTWSEPMGDLWLGSASQSAVPIGGHRLPPLPYSYKALEPWIDEKTMRIHHDKHHQSYVDGLNKAEKKLEEARRSGDFELVKHWERELAFHGAGHYLHTIFWEAMSPRGGGQTSGGLLNEINRSFGSYNAFKKQFTEAANNVEGGGWAILVWSPRSHRLEILTAEKHQNWSQWDVVPLLPLDVWEHAYYLKHQNERPAYTRDWWNVVNWPYVADRFAKARTLKWAPH
ncbi:hypothetical protein SD71_01815 [Cohnella kolymensis]|uniref:superoxide dismutase n=1 Tax=Cohnella kolymensis TaxID=1590652 RepID=A0ABR5A9A3_9BACL|nr:Fe-Mn family superoxide dismutase [Cohnella kolymensis]KIL37418.1 hypothetical protein SD71_01815 [Cohnella kolymensis]